MPSSDFGNPMTVSVDVRLDLALRSSVDAWEAAVADRGPAATAKWIMQRSAAADLEREMVVEAIENLIVAEDPADRALARAEVAEMVQGEDAELADALWFAIRDFALDEGDGDLLTEATTHISEIAFDLDEPTSAAEAWLDFLNWRREPESASDPEAVLTAFDEIIRAAEMDGEPTIAARYGYLQVQFQKLVEADDPRATVGNWLAADQPLESWS
ncbi:MAG TPA: hypothetical protein VEQ36_02615 [Thermomicrobiales bacterium]|nr:hypothetical protein [Thermomicrobiales bacterium]